MPPSYERYYLCTEMYHCTPSELDEQDWFEVAEHIAIRKAVSKANGSRN